MTIAKISLHSILNETKQHLFSYDLRGMYEVPKVNKDYIPYLSKVRKIQ